MEPTNVINKAFEMAKAAALHGGKPTSVKVKVKFDKAKKTVLRKKAAQFGAKTDSSGVTRV